MQISQDKPEVWLELRRLLNSEYDIQSSHAGAPLQTYAVAATPRSGSSFLCLKLWETGKLGAPWEYFHLPFCRPLIRRLHPKTPEDYYDKLQQQRTTPNGVFGFKIFAKAHARIGAKYPPLFSRLSTQKVIYLRREDLDAQAMSLSKAVQSQRWFEGAPRSRVPIHSSDHIEMCRNDIKAQNELWLRLLDRSRADIIEVSYEKFVADTNSGVDSLARHFGVSNTVRLIAVPITLRQTDKLVQLTRSQGLPDSQFSTSDNRAGSAEHFFNYEVGRWTIGTGAPGLVDIANAFGEVLMSFSEFTRDALVFISNSRSFRLHEIPGDLSEQEKVELVAWLVKVQLLKI